MNLKERGITIGDLLILIIIITSLSLIIKKANKNDQTAINNILQKNTIMLLKTN